MLDVVLDGVAPSTNRGLLLLSTVAGLALALISGWLMANSGGGVLNDPDWSVGVLLGSLLIGSGGACLAILHFVRERHDRGLAEVCLAANTAATALALVSFAG